MTKFLILLWGFITFSAPMWLYIVLVAVLGIKIIIDLCLLIIRIKMNKDGR